MKTFNSNGGCTRIIDGDIIVGLTDTEKQSALITEQVAEIDTQLEALDKEYLTPHIFSRAALGDIFAIGQVKNMTSKPPLLETKEKR